MDKKSRKFTTIVLTIFVVCSLFGFAYPLFASPVAGTKLTTLNGKLGVSYSTNTYAVADADYLEGGHMQVPNRRGLFGYPVDDAGIDTSSTSTDGITITSERRRLGMYVTVIDDTTPGYTGDTFSSGSTLSVYKLISNPKADSACAAGATSPSVSVTNNTFDGIIAAAPSTVDLTKPCAKTTASNWQLVINGISSVIFNPNITNSNGGIASGSSLILYPADGSNPGLVSTSSQTFSGIKTFNNIASFSSGASFGGNALFPTKVSNGVTFITGGDKHLETDASFTYDLTSLYGPVLRLGQPGSGGPSNRSTVEIVSNITESPSNDVNALHVSSIINSNVSGMNASTTAINFVPTIVANISPIQKYIGLNVSPKYSGTPSNGSTYNDAIFNGGGSVGIGTINPNGMFEVDQSVNGTGVVSTAIGLNVVSGMGTHFMSTFKTGDTIIVAGFSNTVSSVVNDTQLVTLNTWPFMNTNVPYSTGGGSRFTVFGNGNVGVGTNSPISLFNVSGNPQSNISNMHGMVSIGPDFSMPTYFNGSASGTELALAVPSDFAGNFADFQNTGTSEFNVDYKGNVYASKDISGNSLTDRSLTQNSIPYIDAGGKLIQDNTDLHYVPAVDFNVGNSGRSFLNLDFTNRLYGMGDLSNSNGNTNITVDDNFGNHTIFLDGTVSPSENLGLVMIGKKPPTLCTVGSGCFVGSASGTEFAIIASSTFDGNLADFQKDSRSLYSFGADGTMVVRGNSGQILLRDGNGLPRSQIYDGNTNQYGFSGTTVTANTFSAAEDGYSNFGTAAYDGSGNFVNGFTFVSSNSSTSSALVFANNNSGGTASNTYLYLNAPVLTSTTGVTQSFQDKDGTIALISDLASSSFVGINQVAFGSSSTGIITGSPKFTFVDGSNGTNFSVDDSTGSQSAFLMSSSVATSSHGTFSVAGFLPETIGVGVDPFSGSSAYRFQGSSYGTQLAVNSDPLFAGNFADFQRGGTSKFSIDANGNIFNTGSLTSGGSVTASGSAMFGGGISAGGGGFVYTSSSSIFSAKLNTFNVLNSTGAQSFLHLDTGNTGNLTLGDGTGAYGGFFQIDKSSGTSTWSATLSDNHLGSPKTYFNIDPSNGLYSIGDISHAYNDNYFGVNDASSSYGPISPQSFFTVSNAAGFYTHTGDAYLLADSASKTYQLGDVSGTLGNHDYININDASFARDEGPDGGRRILLGRRARRGDVAGGADRDIAVRRGQGALPEDRVDDILAGRGVRQIARRRAAAGVCGTRAVPVGALMTSPMISAVRDMLLELARVEQAVTAHCAPGAVREHEYMACAKDGHEPCVVCQGGHDLCRRKDRAIADLANYGLALLAADSGTDIEPSLSAQVDRACGVRP